MARGQASSVVSLSIGGGVALALVLRMKHKEKAMRALLLFVGKKEKAIEDVVTNVRSSQGQVHVRVSLCCKPQIRD